MKQIRLNNGDDYSPIYTVLECEFQRLESLVMYYNLFEIEVINNNCQHKGACKDIQKITQWLNQNTFDIQNNDNYFKLVNSLNELNDKKNGIWGDRTPIVKIR